MGKEKRRETEDELIDARSVLQQAHTHNDTDRCTLEQIQTVRAGAEVKDEMASANYSTTLSTPASSVHAHTPVSRAEELRSVVQPIKDDGQVAGLLEEVVEVRARLRVGEV